MEAIYRLIVLFAVPLLSTAQKCLPAEAHYVQLQLTENAPFVDNTCATLDNRIDFYTGVVEFVLSPGSVLPAECTIRRLWGYSCFEKETTRSKRRASKSKSSTSRQSSRVEIDVLVLCNACISAGTATAPYSRRKIIDQDALAAMGSLLIANHNFSVRATETAAGRRTRSRRHTRRNRTSYYCNADFISRISSSTECDCPSECP